MTRKDYERLAAALRAAKTDVVTGDVNDAAHAWWNTCLHIVDALVQDNPRFDKYKFKQALLLSAMGGADD